MLAPYLYTFSLHENPSFIIFSAEEMNNITDCTMLRDATTKKGHHFYTTQIKTSDKTLTIGVKEVSDGKAQTYVSCVNKLFSA